MMFALVLAVLISTDNTSIVVLRLTLTMIQRKWF